MSIQVTKQQTNIREEITTLHGETSTGAIVRRLGEHTGVVGIGTTEPDTNYKLHLAGIGTNPPERNTVVKLDTATTGGHASIHFAIDGVDQWAVKSDPDSKTNSVNDFDILNFNGDYTARPVRIDYENNVRFCGGENNTDRIRVAYARNGAVASCFEWVADKQESENTWIGGSVMIAHNNTTGWAPMYINKFNYVDGTSDNRFIDFITNGGPVIGRITTQGGGNGVSYQATSDYRLKHDIQDIPDCVNKLKQLKPIQFKWNNHDTHFDGFLAHELQQVIPQAVSGDKDAVDEQGEILPQTVETAQLIPLLTRSLQQAFDRIEALEQQIEQLKAQ